MLPPAIDPAVCGSLQISYNGDATDTEALGREKCHVGKTTAASYASSAIEAAIRADGAFDVDEFARHVHSSRNICDVQTVLKGTAAETYELIKAEMDSVGCPHPEKAVAASLAGMGLAHTVGYCVGLDKGSDNVLAVRMMMTGLSYTWCVVDVRIHNFTRF